MRIRHRRTAVLAIATSAAVVVTTGTASAYWSTSGTGRGTARTTNPNWLTVRPGTPTTPLLPGSTGDIAVVIGNPTAAPMLVTTVTTVGGSTPGFSDPQLNQIATSCDSARSGLTVLETAPRQVSFVIGPHDSYTLTLTKAVAMGSDSADACQGVFFAVPVKVTGHTVVGAAATSPAAGTL